MFLQHDVQLWIDFEAARCSDEDVGTGDHRWLICSAQQCTYGLQLASRTATYADDVIQTVAWRPGSHQTLKPKLVAGCVTKQSLPTALGARMQQH
jgi:hypothetical protein